MPKTVVTRSKAPAKPKPPGYRFGRPTKLTPPLAKEICELIATGSSLNSICQRDDMPDYKTVRVWLRKSENFRLIYMQARDDQADFYADELRDIAYDVRADKDEIEKAKLKVDALKWIASKLKPRKYGDKLDLTSDGERIEQPIYGGRSLGKRDTSKITEAEVVTPKQLDKPGK